MSRSGPSGGVHYVATLLDLCIHAALTVGLHGINAIDTLHSPGQGCEVVKIAAHHFRAFSNQSAGLRLVGITG